MNEEMYYEPNIQDVYDDLRILEERLKSRTRQFYFTAGVLFFSSVFMQWRMDRQEERHNKYAEITQEKCEALFEKSEAIAKTQAEFRETVVQSSEMTGNYIRADREFGLVLKDRLIEMQGNWIKNSEAVISIHERVKKLESKQ